jgi:glutamate-ammonia-ligase adenylyltransferase
LPIGFEEDEPPLEIQQLAILTGTDSPRELGKQCEAIRQENRDLLNRLVPRTS